MSATPAPLPVPVGELLAGKYRVERVLGRGGMGVVVAATHEQLRQRVAIKMLLPEAKASPNALARFLREARAAASIHGEHVARVLDVGELEGGAPYIVMEHLEGQDLAAVLKAHGRLPVAEAVGYLLQACEAIAEAHAAGIIHRDLKPSNLFVARRPDGTPMIKVLDFGISKALLATAGEGTLTTTSSFVGSPTYAPPEQLVASHDVDGRADIWCLGTILYEALAGRPPYVGDSVMHVAAKIFHEAPTPLLELRPDLDPALAAAVMKCLGKKPEERFADVRLLAEALAPFAPEASISAERVARIVSASQPTGSSPAPKVLGTARSSSSSGASASVGRSTSARSRGLLLAGLGAAGVAVGFAAFSMGPRQPAPAPTAIRATAGPAQSVGEPEAPVLAAPSSSSPAVSASVAASAGVPDAAPAATATRPQPSASPRRSPLSVGVK